MSNSALAQEWRLQQKQFDSYEKYSLLIKLVSIILTSAALFSQGNTPFKLSILAVLAVLWLQDAIWKTFQSRIEQRLLTLEAALLAEQKSNPLGNIAAYQFNQDFINNRAGGMATIIEYGRQACRPTIAYPHIVLMLLMVITFF